MVIPISPRNVLPVAVKVFIEKFPLGIAVACEKLFMVRLFPTEKSVVSKPPVVKVLIPPLIPKFIVPPALRLLMVTLSPNELVPALAISKVLVPLLIKVLVLKKLSPSVFANLSKLLLLLIIVAGPKVFPPCRIKFPVELSVSNNVPKVFPGPQVTFPPPFLVRTVVFPGLLNRFPPVAIFI